MRLGFFMLTVWMASPCWAAALPDELLYNGKPIEPYCFSRLTDTVKPKYFKPTETSLEQCTQKASQLVIEGRQDDPKSGLGYRYRRITEDGKNWDERGVISYQFLGRYKDADVVLISWSGGGTGSFSSVQGFTRQGDKLISEKGYGNGDKCEGSVEHARVTVNGVEVDQNITPPAFYEMAGIAESKYSTLQRDHNFGCFGYKRSLNGKFIAYIPPSQEDEDSYKSSGNCFVDLFSGQPKRSQWDRAQLKDFMQQYGRICDEKKA